MVYDVEFTDGTVAQITASTDQAARHLAIKKYKDKMVLSVRKAGLMGMLQRRPTPDQLQK